MAWGIWVVPDSVEDITNGINRYLNHPPLPLWNQYLEDNSWELNAKLVINRLGAP